MSKHDLETQVRREFRRKTIAQVVLVIHTVLFVLWVGFNAVVVLNIWWDYGTLLWWTAPGGGYLAEWFLVNFIWAFVFAMHVFLHQYFYGHLKQRRERAVYEEVERRLHLQQARAKLKNDEIFYEDDAYIVGEDGELHRETR